MSTQHNPAVEVAQAYIENRINGGDSPDTITDVEVMTFLGFYDFTPSERVGALRILFPEPDPETTLADFLPKPTIYYTEADVRAAVRQTVSVFDTEVVMDSLLPQGLTSDQIFGLD